VYRESGFESTGGDGELIVCLGVLESRVTAGKPGLLKAARRETTLNAFPQIQDNLYPLRSLENE
jgi:hypothetical protein